MATSDRTAEHIKNLTSVGNFAAKVHAIVGAMRSKGWDARIYSSLRSIGEQRGKVKSGASKTMRSNHLGGTDGLARAADIADGMARNSQNIPSPWSADKEFWLLLGRLALTQGCGWGGLFGLPLGMKVKMLRFMLDRDNRWRAANWMGPIGWDPAHVEARPGWLDRLIVRYVVR